MQDERYPVSAELHMPTEKASRLGMLALSIGDGYALGIFRADPCVAGQDLVKVVFSGMADQAEKFFTELSYLDNYK